ncbi:MAG: hypothetical protein ACT4NY_08985 [Pseudonocardiales bacterium]
MTNLAELPPVLQLLVVLLGGSAVPLIIFLFRRRAELRQLNSASDATLVTSASTLIDKLQEDGNILRTQVADLNTRIEELEDEQRTDRVEFARQLTVAHDETARMSVVVARLKTDLAIAHRQIDALTARMDVTDE